MIVLCEAIDSICFPIQFVLLIRMPIYNIQSSADYRIDGSSNLINEPPTL